MKHKFFNKDFFIEFLAVIFSIAYTVLITYESILCWSAALVSSLLFIYLCYKKKLLAETTLHIFYFAMGIYGWVTWGLASTFEVISYGFQTNMLLILTCFLLILPTGYLLKKYTQAKLPFIDSFTTIFSFMATFMMIHMVLENWLYWVVIDSVSIFLYAKRGLILAAGLYFIYTLLAINGYINWLHA